MILRNDRIGGVWWSIRDDIGMELSARPVGVSTRARMLSERTMTLDWRCSR